MDELANNDLKRLAQRWCNVSLQVPVHFNFSVRVFERDEGRVLAIRVATNHAAIVCIVHPKQHFPNGAHIKPNICKEWRLADGADNVVGIGCSTLATRLVRLDDDLVNARVYDARSKADELPPTSCANVFCAILSSVASRSWSNNMQFRDDAQR